MIEVLEFIFRNFWTFCGFTILLSILVGGVIGIFATIFSK